MADLRPLRALRYDLDVLGREAFALVVTPPYDVIDDRHQDALYAQHPNNFVRIDLNRIQPTDTAENNRYTRARRYLMDWIASGAVTIDREPSVYVHHQTFLNAAGEQVTRRGFLANIRLAEYDESVVLPHERTLRGPKEDRLALMKATETNLSPVFFLYSDPESTLDTALAAAVASSTPASTTTADGIHHELWRVTDPGIIARVTAFMAPQQVLIADGHHRYETALAYREFRRGCAEEPHDDAAYEFGLGFFVNLDDPGLAVFPTHRVVHDLAGFPGFEPVVARLAAHEEFDVSRLGALDRAGIISALTESGVRGPSFVLLGSGEPALVRFVGELSSALFSSDTPDEVRALDVCVLHEALLDGMLGISRAAQEEKTNLHYIKGDDPAFDAVDDAETQIVVLMNATPVDQVDRVCRSGGVMPQKSTFFYPKILSGLVVNPL